jgi:hypothetical protein
MTTGIAMFAPQAAAQNVQSIQTAIVVFAVIVVVFWRLLLKLALAILAIALLILLSSGAFAFFEGLRLAVR